MSKRLKVLVLAQYFPPDIGGASTRASNVVKGLLSRGCEVKVVAAFPHYPHGNVPREYRSKAVALEKVGGSRVLRVWIPALPHNSVANRIILHLCFVFSSLFALPWAGLVDVIWAANPNLFSVFPALVYSFVKRKPLVRNVDDLWPEVFYEMGLVKSKFIKALLDFIAWLSYALPVAITPISDGYKRRIVKKYGVSADKVHVVEVGVDSVGPLKIDKKVSTRFIVMYSGVLGLGYDFDVALEAAGLLAGHEDVLFVIRGVGELAPQLRRRIRELKLRNLVVDTSFLPEEKLSTLLASANVFMLPMTSGSFIDQGLPTKVFEYQTYGKPIVCVSGGEPARYVEATSSGLVVKPRDAQGLAEAVLKLYGDEKLASELGLNGWQYVSANLTVEKIGERIHEVLASIGPQ